VAGRRPDPPESHHPAGSPSVAVDPASGRGRLPAAAGGVQVPATARGGLQLPGDILNPPDWFLISLQPYDSRP